MAQWRDVSVPAGVPGLPSGRQELHGWVFDAFRLDQRDARLWRGQEVVPLHPKPFAVLCYLVTQAGPARDQRRAARGGLARDRGE